MGRAPCCEKNGLKKGPWTPEEDHLLIQYIQKNGYRNWRTLPTNAGLQRCGKSCRLRWTNYLRPDIKRGRFTFEEEETIVQLHSILGNKWSAIAARLPGRTDNEIKNYWNTHIRKRLLQMGIDPVTHAFRLDLLDYSTILNSSHYNSPTSQIRFSTFLRMQPSINPEMMRLASSLPSPHCQNQDFLIQNDDPRAHNQIPPSLIQMQDPFQDFTIPTTCLDDDQIMHYGDVVDFGPCLSGFGSGGGVNEWEQNNESMLSTLTEDYSLPVTNYGYNGPDRPMVDPTPSLETCTFRSNSSNSFGFQSVLSNISTPLSSPAQLQFEFGLQC